MSHLLQMRGLKQQQIKEEQDKKKSHLLQMRGLKLAWTMPIDLTNGRIFYRCVDWNPSVPGSPGLPFVASFTDAWIETYRRIYRRQVGICRIFYRCVDWNKRWSVCLSGQFVSHLLQMRGLKPIDARLYRINDSRIFYRCVDWNSQCSCRRKNEKVASFTDAWIETL